MKLKHSDVITSSTQIHFVFQSDTGSIPDFQGKSGDITVRYEKAATIVYCGLGDKALCTNTEYRIAALKGIQKAMELKRDKVSIVIPEQDATPEIARGIIEGTLLGAYKFSIYKSEKPFQVASAEIIHCPLDNTEFKNIIAVCESVLYTRDLVNDNASVVNPQYLASEALKLASHNGFKVSVLDEKELRKNGLNLIAAVGQASLTPPRLIFIEYTGNAKAKEKTAIVGKGITFDSGGQNHKPTGSIETMRSDMAGAAAVLGVMKSLAAIKPKINVVGVIPAAHNAIGGNAYFPGDIYKAYSGKTVEIWSTDAEGRLVLADAIAYCQEKYKPSTVIDLATLTGGVLYALSDFVAGLFTNSDTLASALFTSGETTGERVWRLPLYKEYCDSIKGELGDIRNVSKLKKGHASSITGAAFIKEFVCDDIAWAHIDIAGTAFNEGSARGDVPANATGYGVRLLMNYLISSTHRA
jgi:leucyl aminopeptidase